ncbi:MAG: glutathione S-transferase family protein, partial [Alphaproteobacteria bacterium]
MKFYDSIGPNPRTVRMFAHEKGINLPTEKVDLMKGENRKEP